MGVKLGGSVPRSLRANGTDYGVKSGSACSYLVEGVSAPVYQRLIAGYVGVEITKMKGGFMIRRLKAGGYRLYSRKKNPKTNKRSLQAAKKHEREVQYFKRH